MSLFEFLVIYIISLYFERRDKVVRVIQPSSSRFQCRGVRSYWARKGRRLAIIRPRPGVTGWSDLKWPRGTPLEPQGHPKTDFARVHIAIRLLLQSDSYHSGVSRSSEGGAQRVRHQWEPVSIRQHAISRCYTQNHATPLRGTLTNKHRAAQL